MFGYVRKLLCACVVQRTYCIMHPEFEGIKALNVVLDTSIFCFMQYLSTAHISLSMIAAHMAETQPAAPSKAI